VFLNQGDGTLGAAAHFPFGLAWNDHPAITAGDIDKDGDEDLVLTHIWATDASVTVLPNLGNAVFGPAIEYPLNGDYPYAVTLADLDGDSYLDMAVLTWELEDVPAAGGFLRVLLNNGDGTFGASSPYQVSGHWAGPWIPMSVAAEDLDGDGNADLVVSATHLHQQNTSVNQNSSVAVFLNLGGGVFQSTPAVYDNPWLNYFLSFPQEPWSQVRLAGFDGDGDVDVAATSEPHRAVWMLLNDGTGALVNFPVTRYLAVRWNMRSFAVDDFDGDGDVDIAAADSKKDEVAILFNVGSELMPRPCPADLDGNGEVGAFDLALLLGSWGPCDGDCPADLDDSGSVGAFDLALLLGAWGACE
ncbi:MAG: VCBS repeat-containing protein, partial [Planctomycetes bacterium]|nr:VCBS repeat-containing protein [Planctomycetota bacterium]